MTKIGHPYNLEIDLDVCLCRDEAGTDEKCFSIDWSRWVYGGFTAHVGRFEWISLKFMPGLVLFVRGDTNGYLSACAALTD